MSYQKTSFKDLTKSKNFRQISYVVGILLIFCAYYAFQVFSQNLVINFYKWLLLVKKFSVDKADFISGMLVVPVLWGGTILLVIAGLKLYKLSPSDIGWREINIKSIWKILVGIMSVPVYHFFFCIFVVHIQYGYLTDFSVKINQPAFDTLMFYYFLIFKIFIGPIVEELFYRGFIQTTLGRKIGFKYALFITSLLFMFAHNHKIHHWYSALNFFALGLVYGLLKKWDGSLWSSTITHSFLNISTRWFPIVCK